ncbi:bifunctional acetate--CoA ligase family protein/GNAT family N-acetyltransferase [Plastoroseomonas arctica]|uniref:GNAT family N-acetyltransferase n=1 Tax=Plastoroseomonas arctica TaxID=1509237 RepID=A0AAF1KMJ1_9PROT|nr:GNAT family N-acetyltransferase [Plastoroseomonas arctica]MBR0653518.1 GNAT family N-acetyltransferase [Plastoroseomonas arctica]
MPDPNLLSLRRKPGFSDAALLRPASVVLVAEEGEPAVALLARNMAAGGFAGRLLAVGVAPDGFEAFGTIAALPAAPDLAVLCLPAAALEPAMVALAARGCFAAICPGAAPDLHGIAARTGVRAMGQGSFGLAIPSIGLNATLSHLAPRRGRLALVTQSSALARAVIDWAEAEKLGFSLIAGIGGNADIGFATVLDWLARDTATGAILLDIRRIREPRRFVSAARAAARTRPVVALRAGGRLFDASGIADAVMGAVLRRAGVLRVAGLEDLLAAAETLARIGPMSGTRPEGIAIVANGTGMAHLAADAILAGGGHLAPFAPASEAALSIALPQGVALRNPLILGPNASTRLGEAAVMLAGLPEVGTVIALHAPMPGENAGAIREALTAAARASRAAPILVGWAGQATGGSERAALADAGIAVFPTPEAAVRGSLHLAADRRNRAAAAELPAADILDVAPDRAVVARLVARLRAEGRRAMSEEEALMVLAAYGMPTVPGRGAQGVEEAAAAAQMLRYPVVLKAWAPELRHKTEKGGVVLNLASAEAVREAARAMARRIPALAGYLVQRQAAPGLELRLRLGDDAMFGPWIGFGRGGTAADIDPDEGIDLPPLNRTLALALMARTRGARLLDGYRDHAAKDRGAIADSLVRLAQLAVDFPEIETLSINPLLAGAEGVLALDAALTLRAPGERARLSIPPYPAGLASPWTAKDGNLLTIRPIRPEDAAALGDFFHGLSAEDIRRRFFSALKDLSPAMKARLTQIDYDREMALVATRPVPGGADAILGVARLIREPGSQRGEFSVVVAGALKGQGLARTLMTRILDWGRVEGLREAVGQVLAENAPMLAFMRALGFTIHHLPEEEGVVEARLTL